VKFENQKAVRFTFQTYIYLKDVIVYV